MRRPSLLIAKVEQARPEDMALVEVVPRLAPGGSEAWSVDPEKDEPGLLRGIFASRSSGSLRVLSSRTWQRAKSGAIGPMALLKPRLMVSREANSAGPRAVMCDRFLQRYFVQCFMMVLTLAVLYCGDLVQAVAEVSYDSTFSVLLYVCLVCFAAEWILNVIASAAQTPPYICSLFFFLDFVATFSIALDIIVLEANNLAQGGPVARAARAARVGTRAGRSMRLMRLMRFLRLVRITRFVKAMLAHRIKVRRALASMPDDEVMQDLARADTIGAQIGAATTKKVIIMTLMLLIMISLLERSDQFQICNGELVASLEGVYRADSVGWNCTKFQREVGPWFNDVPGVVSYSRHRDTGLTQNGLIAAIVERCALYEDVGLVGPLEDPTLRHLARYRRGSEILVIPCDACFSDIDGNGRDDRSPTFFLYDMRQESIEEASYAMATTTVIIVALLGFSMIFSSDAEAIANRLVVPISQLMEDMSHTAKLELDKVTHSDKIIPSEVYEVRSLQAAFHNLNAAVRSFSKFTPLEVVRHFLSLGSVAQLGVVERNVSIFFSDIAGWTTICERCQPQEVLGLLSEYFESMVSIIIEEKGTMLEFIGDAILAVWNAPNDVPDHAVRSITTALRMNTILEKMRRQWSSGGKPEIRIRVGLHSARVFVGNLGSNVRMKYGVLGDGVNLASRLEELNKRYKTEALISEDVLREPGVGDTFFVRPVDLVVVKGRHEPTRLFEVLALRLGASEDTRQVATISAQAMRAYLERDFEQALQCLKLVKELKGGVDAAGKVLATRCREFLEQPPPSDWDGSEVLKEKTF